MAHFVSLSCPNGSAVKLQTMGEKATKELFPAIAICEPGISPGYPRVFHQARFFYGFVDLFKGIVSYWSNAVPPNPKIA